MSKDSEPLLSDLPILLSSAFSVFLRPLVHYLDKPSLPKYAGPLALAGLRDQVKVQFQDYAIPHVFASNEHDLFFTQGFLHAQERLWQMESMRRFLSGRIAEILPFRAREAAQNDYFMRLIGVRQAVIDTEAMLDEQVRAHLRSYAGGVNRYIERCGKKLPWEFRLLRYSPEPWQPLDSMTIAKGFALLLSTALYTRLHLIALANQLAHQPEKLRALWPAESADRASITTAVWSAAQGLWHFTNGNWSQNPWHSAGHGSNNWAVAANRSTTGHAILCNDPHLRFALPAMFYLMKLRADGTGYDASGASMPGLPYIQLGHNREIAWGVTAALCDDAELYREKLHPVDPSLYQGVDSWQPFSRRQEIIGVRGRSALKRTIRATRHGPVISDYDKTQKQDEVLALRWTAHEPSQEFLSVYGINQARNWSEFRAALSQHGAPCLNYVYADRSNNIGYALAGKIPIRAAANTRLPVEGWRIENDWCGFIPFAELPRVYNPPEGMVASANNRIVNNNHSTLAQFAEPPHRIRRISDLLQADKRLSTRDMAAIQMDAVSLHAKELLETLATDLHRTAVEFPALAKVVEQLLAWDGSCHADSTEAALFHVWHQRLMANLLMPSLGENVFRGYIEILNQCIEPLEHIFAEADSHWFTARSRRDVVSLSLREAVDDLRRRLGANVGRWTWGRLHRLMLRHPLGRHAPLGCVVNLGPIASPGDGMTINAGNYQHSNPYDHYIGAALRMIVDTGQWHQSGFILPGGQSGHPASPHYRDQLELWRQGRTIKIAVDEAWPTEHCLNISPC